MATDYLKSFTAGEKITAAETNDNNQYLLNQISENAKELQAYIEQEMAKFAGNFVQPGFVIGLPCDVIPVGYLKCDGSSLLRADSAEGMNDGYADLFKAIGTIYGAVDDYHFNLPDFQGKFLRGFGGNSASIGTLQDGGLPNITGGPVVADNRQGTGNYGAFKITGIWGGGYDWGGGTNYRAYYFDASWSNPIYQDGLTEVRPDNYAVHWIIKY